MAKMRQKRTEKNVKLKMATTKRNSKQKIYSRSLYTTM